MREEELHKRFSKDFLRRRESKRNAYAKKKEEGKKREEGILVAVLFSSVIQLWKIIQSNLLYLLSNELRLITTFSPQNYNELRLKTTFSRQNHPGSHACTLLLLVNFVLVEIFRFIQYGLPVLNESKDL